MEQPVEEVKSDLCWIIESVMRSVSSEAVRFGGREIAAPLEIVDLRANAATRSTPIIPQVRSFRTAGGFVGATAGAIRAA